MMSLSTSHLPRHDGNGLRFSGRERRAFSLVEVTISLGIVAFGLVGVLGALPLAMSSGRYSFEQTRASYIANTLFATMRAQNFAKVYYLSEQVNPDGTTQPTGTPINLVVEDASGKPSIHQFFASVTDVTETDPIKSLGSIQFTEKQAGAEFGVKLLVNNRPGVSTNFTQPVTGVANQVELQIYALDHPKDVYRFVSVIANRADNATLVN